MFIKVGDLSVGQVEARGGNPHTCGSDREAAVRLHPEGPPGQLPGDLITRAWPGLQLYCCAGLGWLVWCSQGLHLGPQVSPGGAGGAGRGGAGLASVSKTTWNFHKVSLLRAILLSCVARNPRAPEKNCITN